MYNDHVLRRLLLLVVFWQQEGWWKDVAEVNGEHLVRLSNAGLVCHALRPAGQSAVSVEQQVDGPVTDWTGCSSS